VTFARSAFLGLLTLAACQLIAGIDDRSVWDGSVIPGSDGGCDQPGYPDTPPQQTSSPSDNVEFNALVAYPLRQAGVWVHVVSNGRNKRSRTNSASMPRPVSETSIAAEFPSERIATLT